MREADYERGRIVAVEDVPLGSELVADVLAGSSTILVDDAADFDEDGGTLQVGEALHEYETVDDETGEILLVDPLADDAFEGDRICVYDTLRQIISSEKVCQVRLDNTDGNDDAIEATLAHYLADAIPEGIRGEHGESVTLELDGDEWRVVDVLGLAQQGGGGSAGGGATHFWQDEHEALQAGEQRFELTHTPLPHSEHLYWNGLYQRASQWEREARRIIVPDVSGLIVAGDRLTVEYAYHPARDAISEQPQAGADGPWWTDPTLGCASGYPAQRGVTFETEWRNIDDDGAVRSRELWLTVAGLSMEFLDPSRAWRVYAVWQFAPDDPPQDTNPPHVSSVHVARYGAVPPGYDDTWRWAHLRTEDATASAEINVGNNGAPRSAKIAFTGKDASALLDAYQAYWPTLPSAVTPYGVGYIIVSGSDPYTNALTIPIVPDEIASPSNQILGTTRGDRCRFYIGDGIASGTHPNDAGATAEPY